MGALRSVPKLYCNAIPHGFQASKLPTHELLARLNIVAHPRSGLVHWLPMGQLILDKVSTIIRKHMHAAGFEHVLLSPLAHRLLWEKTGRWSGKELFKVVGDEFLLAPTAEEEITDHVCATIKSYKELPLKYYQLGTKFRNELRSRGGLLRGKQFIMKDGYSFDVSPDAAMITYQEVQKTYHAIFKDLGIPYVVAEADSGAIGGSLSHEWHCLHSTGEDTVFSCDKCHHVSNAEKTVSFPDAAASTHRVSVRYFLTRDGKTLVCAYYPAHRDLDVNLVKSQVLLIGNQQDEEEILLAFSCVDPLDRKVVRLMDARLNSRLPFPDFPVQFVNRGVVSTVTDVPLVVAQAGEICGQCDEGRLVAHRAIELGHTFYLGDKYTQALGCRVSVPQEKSSTKLVALSMGCYGIGVSRLIAVGAEIGRDAHGLAWPRQLAPWEVTVVESVKGDYEHLYGAIRDMDYRVDDRLGISLGRKVSHSALVGIPVVVILGKLFPMVEIEVRRPGKHWQVAFTERDFEWTVETRPDNSCEKHTVHADNAERVLRTLLMY